jgi:hypothetical protein
MKFLDIINESEEERLLKRGRTIFKAFKEGTITRSDGVSFSYILDNNVEMMVKNGELELYGSVSKIIENTYCPINERYMTELIENRFRKFYITTDLIRPSKDNIHKFQGKKPWEEDLNDLVYLNESKEELSEDAKLLTKEDPSEEKRVRTIFNALKKGVVKVQHPRTDEIIKFRYHIDNVSYKWEHYTMMEKHLTIVTDNFPGEGITIYSDDEDIVDKCTNDLESMSRNPTGFHLREMFVNKLKSKFDNFNVSVQVNKRGMKFVLDKPKEPINESNEDELIRKGKLIFKALRKGTIGSEDEPNKPMFTYELSNDMSVSLDYGQIIIFTDEVKIVELNEPCVRMSTDLMARKISNRFKQFKVTLSHPPIHPFNVDSYYDRRKKEELNEQNELINLNDEDIKRVKLVHKAIRKGIVKVNDVRYRYEFPEKYYLSPTLKRPMIGFDFNKRDINKKDGGLKLPLKVWRIEEGEEIYINSLLNPRDVTDIVHGQHYHLKDTTMEYMMVKNTVRRRYDNFSIALDLHYTVKPRTVNEQNIPRREPSKEQKKRAKIFYDAFKTGKFTVEGDKQHNEHGGTYKYVLPDEYWTTIDDDGELCVILTMNPEQTMEMYYTHKDHQTGEIIEKHINRLNRKHLYQWMVDSIKRKFKQFQINIIF